MSALATHIVDTLLEDEQSEQTKETNETVLFKESICIINPFNTFDFILNIDKKSVEEAPQSKPLPATRNKLFIIV